MHMTETINNTTRLDSKPDENKDLFKRFSKSIFSIRAISIIGIFIYHFGSWSYFQGYYNLEYDTNLAIRVLFDVGEIGVDFFAFLSSMFLILLMADKDPKDISWGNWYKKRGLRIYLPMWLSVLVIVPINMIFIPLIYPVNSMFIQLGGFGGMVGDLIVGYDWFLTFILVMYAVLPILFIGLKKSFKITSLIITIAFIFLIFGFYPYMYFGGDADVYQSIHRVFSFLFGAVFGFWIGKNNKENLKHLKDNRVGIISGISLGASFTGYVVITPFMSTHVGHLYHEKLILFVLITISFITFFSYLLMKYQNLSKPLLKPGKISYEAYLIHVTPWLIILFLFYKIVWIDYFTSLLLVPFALTAFIVLCWVMAYPMNKINNFIAKQKKLEKAFLLVIGSLIIYTFVQLALRPFIYSNDLLALIVFGIILSSVIGGNFLYDYIKAKK